MAKKSLYHAHDRFFLLLPALGVLGRLTTGCLVVRVVAQNFDRKPKGSVVSR